MHIHRSEKQAVMTTARWQQHGVILPIFAIGMLAVLAMAGLALDVSHALLNKSRLQNTVDAAALAGAEELLQGSGLIANAEAVARAMFAENQSGAGNAEMAADIAPGEVFVEFSEGLKPFTPGAGQGDAEYVRVRVENFTMPAWLIRILRIDEKIVRASAVAGASPTLGAACDIVPLIVCGDPDAGGPLWGYEEGEVNVLKASSETGGSGCKSEIGPGNFQLARLGGSGADVVRENLAGGFEGCAITDSTIPTEPGNSVGPVAQGLNTRFGNYSGPIKPGDGYPSDVITDAQGSTLEVEIDDKGTPDDCSDDEKIITLNNGSTVVTNEADLDFNYNDYTDDLLASDFDVPPSSGGAFNRRNLSVVIADCTGKNTGATDLPVLGLGCYFMLQEVTQKGSEAEVYGQFLESCEASGVVGPDPEDIPGPFIIQLYKDSGSTDS